MSGSPFTSLRDEATGLVGLVRPGTDTSALLVLLHGVGGNESNLVALAEQVDPRVEVVLLRAPLTLGHQQFAWFQVQFGPSGPVIDASQAEASRQLLARFVTARRTASDSASPRRVVVAGFSQGGIMSASVGLTTPQSVDGFAILSGRILPEIDPLIAPRDALAGLQAWVGHGSHDDKLPVAWAERSAERLNALGVRNVQQRYPMGHGISPDMAHDFLDWLAEPLSLSLLSTSS